MVFTAAALFPILFLAAFAIDVSHWWDYSRNLQNRADAAALAAGASFGNICLEGGNPGDTTTGWNLTNNGYLNNTTAASPLKSPLTLRLGNLNDYWVRLNARDYVENGG